MSSDPGPAEPAPIELRVDETEAHERLDRVLARRELGFSRATLQRWIAEGRVRVEGQQARSSTRVRAGARVVVQPAPPAPSSAEPEDIPLSVLYEDQDLIVIDKAAGMVVHPAPGHRGGTLVNALRFRTELEADATNERAGIVHRLDKDTSGVMVVAKTAAAREGLVAQFTGHSIERQYRAICVGHPPERVRFDTWHGRHPVDRKRFSSRVSKGKRAVTELHVLERLHGASLLCCRLHTGRTHQIRVHLADHRFAVLGDPVYGRPGADPLLKRVAARLGRQALHASVLGFVHPRSGAPLRFESEPPADFCEAIEALRPSPDSQTR